MSTITPTPKTILNHNYKCQECKPFKIFLFVVISILALIAIFGIYANHTLSVTGKPLVLFIVQQSSKTDSPADFPISKVSDRDILAGEKINLK